MKNRKERIRETIKAFLAIEGIHSKRVIDSMLAVFLCLLDWEKDD